MRRALTTSLVAAALGLAALSAFVAHAAPAPASRIVIILSPYLSWDDLNSIEATTLARVAREGAVGNINIRNRNLAAHEPDTVEQGALTFSAGTWAAVDDASPSAYSANEAYNAGTAGEAYTRLTGLGVDGNDVVYLGMPRVERLNAAAGALDVQPGTIGGEIVAAGGVTAAIGNSDLGAEEYIVAHNRPAALVAMDYDGKVRFGDVSSRLLRDEIAKPYGVSSDFIAFSETLTGVESALQDEQGPALVVLDPGDLTRAAAVEGVTAPALAAGQHAQAVRTLDRVVARALETLPDDGLLMVLTPVETETSETVPGLAPAIVYGRGYSGELTSSSTQRPGLVTNLDVAATVLDAFGIERPVNVLGAAMTSDGSAASLEYRIAHLEQVDATGMSIDIAKPAVVNGFIGATLAVLLLSTLLLLRARRWRPTLVRRLAAASRIALLGVLAVPPASLLMFMVDGRPGSSARAVFELFAVAFALWMVLLLIKRYTPLHVPVAVAALGTAAIMLLDQWLGAPWSFTSFLGYSPLMAARYYGIGNEGAAILFGSSLLGLAFLFDTAPESRITALGRRWLLPFVGFLVVATCAAPFLGANVGVAAWGVVGYAVAWALMNGHRVSWKVGLAIIIIMVLMVGVFSVIDLTGSGGEQTHLGRAWQSADQGGFGELWLIVQRKAQTNLRVLTHTNWSFILIGMLAFIGFMRWHPRGDFADTLDENPHYSAMMAASLVGGLAAYFTEDSGIVIPALITLYVGVGILYLMTARLSWALSAEEDLDGSQAGAGEGAA